MDEAAHAAARARIGEIPVERDIGRPRSPEVVREAEHDLVSRNEVVELARAQVRGEHLDVEARHPRGVADVAHGDADLCAPLDERLDEPRADKARAPGHQHPAPGDSRSIARHPDQARASEAAVPESISA